jgi:hypothetical protein
MFRAMEQVPFLRQFFSPTIIWGALPLLWRGFQVAVSDPCVSYSVGIPLGLMLAFMKMARLPILRMARRRYRRGAWHAAARAAASRVLRNHIRTGMDQR